MTWQASLNTLRIPFHPGGAVGDVYWRGLGDDVGLLLYTFGGDWVICDKIGYDYIYGGNRLRPVHYWLNGYCYFSGGSYYLWYSTTYGWVLTTTGPGVPPLETWVWTDSDDHDLGGSYTGDSFYSGTLPALDGSASFAARGSLRGTVVNAYSGSPATISTRFDRWEKEESPTVMLGDYLWMGDGDGDPSWRFVGLPQYKDQNGKTYVRSLAQTGGNYSYGDIHNSGDAWLIGTVGAATGWWVLSAEPNREGSVTATFTAPEPEEDEDPVTGENLTITFDQMVTGTEPATVYLGEASIWR